MNAFPILYIVSVLLILLSDTFLGFIRRMRWGRIIHTKEWKDVGMRFKLPIDVKSTTMSDDSLIISWIVGYFFLGIGIILLCIAIIPIINLLAWQDILWTSGLLAWVGSHQVTMAYNISKFEYEWNGYISTTGPNVRLFGLILLISSLGLGLFAKNSPPFALTLFDFLP